MNIIETAIKMKTDAIRYYEEAVGKCLHPAGKKMFQVILQDEKNHLESLKQLMEGMKVDTSSLSPVENVKNVLETVKDDMRVQTACTLDETEAFRIAMDMEKAALEFYRTHAADAKTGTERALFEKVAHEEEEHYRIFSNTHDFLDDTGNWFMWEEHSIVEG